MTLDGIGKTKIAEAYCLDKHLYASNSFVPYTRVIDESSTATVRVGTAAPISLQAALDRKIIVIEGSAVWRIEGRTIDRDEANRLYGPFERSFAEEGGSGLGVRFKSNVAQPVTIRLKDPTAFGEQEGQLVAKDSPLLAPLQPKPVAGAPAVRARSAAKSAAQIQDDVWKAQEPERILAEINYLHEPVNPEQINSSVTKFQGDHGLAASGTLDEATKSELKKEDKAILDELSSIGFAPRKKGPTEPQIVAASESLQQFSRYHDMPATGVYTDALKDQAKKDAQLRDQLREIASRAGGPDNILVSAEFPNVVTFYRTKSGITALCKSDGKLDSWSIEGDLVQRLGTGDAALKELEAEHQRHVSSQGSDEISVLPAGYSEDLSVRASQLMYIDSFLSADEGESNHAGKKKILLAVSPLLQGRSAAELAKEDAWTKSAGNPLLFAKQLQADIRGKADVFVTNDALLGIENLNNLPTFSAPKELAIYVDGKLQDRGVVDTLFGAIDKTKIQVVAADQAKPGQARVSLMVGENDADFRELVLKMADQGIFKDGVLALAKCGEGGELVFNSEIIHRSKARAVIFYDELINIQAVKDVLYEFTKELRENGIPDGDFKSAWFKSVNRAAANSTGTYKEQILKLQNVHVQVRKAEPPVPDAADAVNA